MKDKRKTKGRKYMKNVLNERKKTNKQTLILKVTKQKTKRKIKKNYLENI